MKKERKEGKEKEGRKEGRGGHSIKQGDCRARTMLKRMSRSGHKRVGKG